MWAMVRILDFIPRPVSPPEGLEAGEWQICGYSVDNGPEMLGIYHIIQV